MNRKQKRKYQQNQSNRYPEHREPGVPIAEEAGQEAKAIGGNPPPKKERPANPQEPRWHWSLYWLQLINSNHLMAAFTGALVIATGLQWKASRDSIDLAIRTLEISERPHVYSDGVEWTEDRRFVVVSFTNYGKGPALRTTDQYQLTATNNPGLPELRWNELLPPYSAGDIGPSVSAKSEPPATQSISAHDFEEIGRGNASAYVFGVIAYRDSFGHEHASPFCSVFNVRRAPGFRFLSSSGTRSI